MDYKFLKNFLLKLAESIAVFSVYFDHILTWRILWLVAQKGCTIFTIRCMSDLVDLRSVPQFLFQKLLLLSFPRLVRQCAEACNCQICWREAPRRSLNGSFGLTCNETQHSTYMSRIVSHFHKYFIALLKIRIIYFTKCTSTKFKLKGEYSRNWYARQHFCESRREILSCCAQ